MHTISKVYRHFAHDSLYRNSIYLILSTAIMAVFGFFFWIINARLFSSTQIGLATTLVSIVTLISGFSMLGLNNGIIRYLPGSEQKSEKINTAITLVSAASVVLAIIYLLGIEFFSPKLAFIKDNIFYTLLFILFVMFASLNVITDSIFVAFRTTKYVLIKNTSLSIVKIILPIFLVSFGAVGIFSSYGFGMFAAILLSVIFLMRSFAVDLRPLIDGGIVRKMFSFASGNYLASFIGIFPGNILPILITNKLGPNLSAFYYLDMMIGNLLFIIPLATSQSLFAESSYSNQEIKQLLGKAIKIIALLITPSIIITVFFGKYVLLSFGKQYSSEGFQLLQIIALSGIFVSVNYVGTTLLNVRHKVSYIILVNVINAFFVLLLSFIFISKGLLGIGYAWIISQGITATLYLVLIKKFGLSN